MAGKVKTMFVCTNCGAEYMRWQGQCKSCGEWNTLEQTQISTGGPKSERTVQRSMTGFAGAADGKIENLSTVKVQQTPRLHTGYGEFDRVLGGGIVPGSVVLIGGNPGAGKSTLLLQTVCKLSNTSPVLYVTGEESLEQVALRAQRLALPTDKVRIGAETSIDNIIAMAMQEKPAVLVVDSIQVMHVNDVESAPGSVSQVREAAAALTQFAKRTGIAVFLVGHVTKEGSLAGPKVLEHCVDCSVLLEAGNDMRYRTLRCHKNRFGAVNEIGVFAMTDHGMHEIKNPSAIFLNRQEQVAPGSLATVVWEGSRPLLVELQGLVDISQYNNPRRLSLGTDANRLSMLLSVLHRHAGIQLADQDVFVNVVGGIKIDSTSADVPLILALLSSFTERPIERTTIAFGEIGLTGEIRPVQSGLERLNEAEKQGFLQAIVPVDNCPSSKRLGNMQIVPVKCIQELVDLV